MVFKLHKIINLTFGLNFRQDRASFIKVMTTLTKDGGGSLTPLASV